VQALESIELPESKRKNVTRRGDTFPRGMCLGMTESWTRGPTQSTITRQKPLITMLLCDFVRWEVPGFEFTSIQVNKDYAAALHVDKNDAGNSIIIGLGDYSGGELWVDDGSCSGHCLDVRDTWHRLEGHTPHEVMPFKGRRYTLVYFTRERGGDIGADTTSRMTRRLRDLGFQLPSEVPLTASYPPADERMAAGQKRVHKFTARAGKLGGPRRLKLMLRPRPCNKEADEDEDALRLSVDPNAPIKALMEAVKHMKSFTTVEASEPCLWVDGFRLLPWDTPGTLGLTSGMILHVAA